MSEGGLPEVSFNPDAWHGLMAPIASVLAAAPGLVTAPPTLAALAGLGVLLVAWGATAFRQPSLVAALKAAIGEAWIKDRTASQGLRIGMSDAQLVLEWVEKAVAERAQAGAG